MDKTMQMVARSLWSPSVSMLAVHKNHLNILLCHEPFLFCSRRSSRNEPAAFHSSVAARESFAASDCLANVTTGVKMHNGMRKSPTEQCHDTEKFKILKNAPAKMPKPAPKTRPSAEARFTNRLDGRCEMPMHSPDPTELPLTNAWKPSWQSLLTHVAADLARFSPV